MGRLVLAALLCAASTGVAYGGPTRDVEIVTEPKGATVYIDDTESGIACEPTPCVIHAPIGEPTIIIRLDKYEPSLEAFPVPKGKRPLKATFKLKSAIGTIIVEQKGVSVQVDKEDKGTVGSEPIRIDVSAEPHSVVITQNGKTVFDDFVDVATGDEQTIGPKTQGWHAAGTAVAHAPADGGGEAQGDQGDGGGGGGGESGAIDTGVEATAPPVDRTHFISVGVVTDVGFRHFTYDQPMTSNLREESEGGQVIAGPAVELWPMRLAGASHLRGLSLFVRAQFGVHGQQLTGDNLMNTVTTFWASYEGSLRHRWMFGGIGVEASGGFVRDQMQFNAKNANDIKVVPDAIYQSLRIGAKLVLVSGPTEVYLSGENRIVLSGGALETRFDSAKASGFRGAIGLARAIGPLAARFEASLTHYSWTFTYDGVNDVAQADGATDSVKIISIELAYAK